MRRTRVVPVCWWACWVLLLAPARAFAQAEPAPPDYHPPPPPGAPAGPPVETPPTPRSFRLPSDQPKWHLSLGAHVNLRLGDAPDGVPLVGYGADIEFTRALAALGHGRFGVGGRFGYDRFSLGGAAAVGHATFAALIVFDGFIGRVRPWGALGGGFSVETFGQEGSANLLLDVVGLVTAAVGVSLRVWQAAQPPGETPRPSVDLGLRADVNLTFSSDKAGMPPREVFSPGWFTFGLELGFRF